MTPPSPAARLAIAALLLLGLLGGSLIVAHGGFETSPRRGGTPTFVPAPLAYVIAAFMYLMSCLAMLALVRGRYRSPRASAAAIGGYLLVAWLVVRLLTPWVR